MKRRPTSPLTTVLPDEGAPAPRIERDAPGIALRLAIGRSGIGFELARPARAFGFATVQALDIRLPGIRFPLDVSGGVSRFRHRRGELVGLTLEIDRTRAIRWAAGRLRGLVSIGTPELWVKVRPGAATLALISPRERDRDSESERGARRGPPAPPAILAFELVLLAGGADPGDLRFVVAHARGTGLSAPPTALALAAGAKLVQTAATRGTRSGAIFTLPDALGKFVRHLLPEAGVRSPETRSAAWSGTAAAEDAWILQASRDGESLEPSEEAVRAAETARLSRASDDARAAGAYPAARALDVTTLGGAARHPEIARRIAEVDHAAGGRAEAALALLRDVERSSEERRGREGTLRAELLEAAGDLDGARAAFVRAGETEEVPALAAEAFRRAALLLGDPFDALVWLDRAVAERPESSELRWARVERRLSAGRIADARADVEAIAASLEPAAREITRTYRIWRRAGDLWRRSGLRAEASALYERALAAVPDDPAALAGLGIALAEGGRGSRGAALLARAIELGEARGQDTSVSELALAIVLADKLQDLPAAAARARAVSGDAPRAAEARGLEGRWRAAMGDRIGASLAFARLREAVETSLAAGMAAPVPGPRSSTLATLVALLVEAAAFEREVRGDLASAQRHLGSALALVPSDERVSIMYREISAELAPRASAPERPSEGSPGPIGFDTAEHAAPYWNWNAETTFAPPLPAAARGDAGRDAPAPGNEPAAELDEAEASARVDDLVVQLRARPEDEAIVEELARLLTALNRGFELLALLSARLEDASPEARIRLLPRQRAVLDRLASDAEADGRAEEAAIFRDARSMLDD